ncbi:type II toxin-antitoxin system RelE/ParE family toxin [Planctomicrobium piriforme]|uniref:Plasmid stabilization system protein ParE n=1 Tax=Planctomicrobium piriforme TaxID=1576369 RepID=A0A1I3KTW6_9PLAN|nr:type II toxin-antitoxin system RelE/ParE family toxin [Planctomicrobium piriforme]SFI75824.1 Plasmid stabilization system protein ParE [Planctomicrobium piriforme]
MTYEILISLQAQADVREAVAWWRDQRSAEQAERWLDKIYPAISTLANSPDRCPFAPETDLLATGLRQLHFGVSGRTTHRIVFTIHNRQVVILRVRHIARRDLTIDDLS